MARNWADLPPELLGLCSQHLCPKDLSALRAVCPSWRSAAVEESSDVPWLMLADKEGTKRREFFCLLCQQVHKKLMPEVKEKICFSSLGWVLTVSKDCELHMLKNPMSRHGHIIELPDLNEFPDHEDLHGDFITKFVLSDSPATSLDYTAMVIYGNDGRLGLWKPGRKEWMAVASPEYYNFDVVSYKGFFVALNRNGSILRWDVDGPTPFEARVVFTMRQKLLGCEQAYLVQSMTGSLLVVSRLGQQVLGRTFGFQVFEVDLDTQTSTEVKSLESASLFLGRNSSFSLEVDEKHHVKPNCIYFTDDFLESSRHPKQGGGKDMGIYHLGDGTIEPHFRGKSYSHFSPPLWIDNLL